MLISRILSNLSIFHPTTRRTLQNAILTFCEREMGRLLHQTGCAKLPAHEMALNSAGCAWDHSIRGMCGQTDRSAHGRSRCGSGTANPLVLSDWRGYRSMGLCSGRSPGRQSAADTTPTDPATTHQAFACDHGHVRRHATNSLRGSDRPFNAAAGGDRRRCRHRRARTAAHRGV